MEAVGSITGMEYLQSDSEVPKLIDFFKSEMPLLHDRHMGKQEFLCKRGNQKWSTIPTLVSTSPECAIADGEERQMEPILVDFFKGGNGARNGDPHHHGVDAAVLKRYQFQVPSGFLVEMLLVHEQLNFSKFFACLFPLLAMNSYLSV